MCQLRCVKNCFCYSITMWSIEELKIFILFFLFSLLFSFFVFFFVIFIVRVEFSFVHILHIACNPTDPFHFHADVINHLTAWALDRCDLLQLFIHTFCPSVHSWIWCIFCVAKIFVYSTLLCSLHQIIWGRSPATIKWTEKQNG